MNKVNYLERIEAAQRLLKAAERERERGIYAKMREYMADAIQQLAKGLID